MLVIYIILLTIIIFFYKLNILKFRDLVNNIIFILRYFIELIITHPDFAYHFISNIVQSLILWIPEYNFEKLFLTIWWVFLSSQDPKIIYLRRDICNWGIEIFDKITKHIIETIWEIIFVVYTIYNLIIDSIITTFLTLTYAIRCTPIWLGKIYNKILFETNALYKAICDWIRNQKKDLPRPWQFNFQDPATAAAEGMAVLHHDIMFVLTFIVLYILWIICRTIYLYRNERNLVPSTVTYNSCLEIIWTIIPTIFLILILLPSFSLLFAIDDINTHYDPDITIKIIANQWYWTYSYYDKSSFSYDSYMMLVDDIIWNQRGELRLLAVDNRLLLPINTNIRFLITSRDVLHSFTIPSLGIKLDACPGRLNQIHTTINRAGIFYGQCSEICGVNHGFMPIVIQGVNFNIYNKWLLNLNQQIL